MPLKHITNEFDDCVSWCPRCKKISEIEKRYVDYTFIDVLEYIIDLQEENKKLEKELEIRRYGI